MVVGNKKALRKEIKQGLGDGKRVEVISGIVETDEVVEANPGSLVDGQAVEPQPPAPKPKS